MLAICFLRDSRKAFWGKYPRLSLRELKKKFRFAAEGDIIQIDQPGSLVGITAENKGQVIQMVKIYLLECAKRDLHSLPLSSDFAIVVKVNSGLMVFSVFDVDLKTLAALLPLILKERLVAALISNSLRSSPQAAQPSLAST